MFQGWEYLGAGLLSMMTPMSLFNVAWATLLGIAIGILPGLTATMGVALLVTFTYPMAPDQAILTLMCVYIGAIYGGSRTAILLNIPGTPASAASTLDGYPLAQQGKAGLAMGLATTSSALGTLVGVLFLALVAPLLSEAALKFGSYEFFWLGLFGVLISGLMTGSDNPLKGYIAGILGLLVAMVGMESLHAYTRFTFGIHALGGGIDLIPAMVGAFGLAEILSVVKQRVERHVASVDDRVVPSLREIFRYWRTIIRSGVIGTFIGIIPGVGEDVGAWTSYAAAKRFSKHPEQFGKGSQEGLIAAETGDNAVIPGAMIPTLTLAIPGSAASAVLIAAMFIHGIRPGPMLMIENPTFLYQVVAMLLLATAAILAYGLLADAAPHQGAAGAARAADGGGLRPLPRRRLRDHPADVRRLGDAGLRGDRLRAPRDEVSDGAAGAGADPRRPHRRQPAARTAPVGRRPVAVLHPADLAGDLPGDRRLGRPQRSRGQAPARRRVLPPEPPAALIGVNLLPKPTSLVHGLCMRCAWIVHSTSRR